MLFAKGLRGVRIYYDDELIGESEPCFVNEPVPIKISQNDTDIAMETTTHYDIKQDPDDGKWYLYADGVRVCEASPKTEK